MDEISLRAALKDLPIGGLEYFPETDSTNERALAALGEEGKQIDYRLLVAGRQTAGRGRLGRSWVTTPGASLAVTLIIHPDAGEQEKTGLFSLLGALSICRALETFCESGVQVKWPNDVLLQGRKTAGVLAESRWEGSQLRGIALGMGINILPESVPSGQELLFPATCVQAHCQQAVDALQVLHAVLKELFYLRAVLTQESFIREYMRFLTYQGEKVILSLPGNKTVFGTLLGIDDSGQLILKNAEKEEIRYPIGDLRLRPG